MLENLREIPEHSRTLIEAERAVLPADAVDYRTGVVLDDDGRAPVRESVKLAEERLLDAESTKNYLPLAGDPDYRARIGRLLLPGALQTGDHATLQAPGGTAALRWVAELIRRESPATRVWLPEPTWPNHHGILKEAGVDLTTYGWPVAEGRLDLDRLLKNLQDLRAGDALLLHGCCHNPTGFDPDREGWTALAGHLVSTGAWPWVDLAFVGYGAEPEEDLAGLRRLSSILPGVVVTASWSKTFGLYRERPGSVTVTGPGADRARRHLEHIGRGFWSTPPAHGARVAALILGDPGLQAVWRDELREIRERVAGRRRLLAEALGRRFPNRDWSGIREANCLFTHLPMSPGDSERLSRDHGLHIHPSGLMNLSVGPEDALLRLAEAL